MIHWLLNFLSLLIHFLQAKQIDSPFCDVIPAIYNTTHQLYVLLSLLPSSLVRLPPSCDQKRSAIAEMHTFYTEVYLTQVSREVLLSPDTLGTLSMYSHDHRLLVV
jgi:hypothetical protein